MKKAYVQVNDRLIHYRTEGSGPPLVMLHPSPLSSASAVPVAAGFSQHCEVFALDTPGYGLSDPLATEAESLQDYLPALLGFLDAMGIEKACIYGAATGAQIAIQFALLYPERVSLLVLDSCGHIDDDDCEAVIQDYFPDLTPRLDGSHLATAWQIAVDLSRFFPWCDRTEASRLYIDQPPAEIQQLTVLGYLQAGPEYWRAYEPAFRAERAIYVQQLSVPTVVTRWESSIVLGITDALLQHELPDNIESLPLGPTLADRVGGLADYVAVHYASQASARGRTVDEPTQRFYLGNAGQQLHVRGSLAGSGRPIVLLHDPAGSGALLQPMVEALLSNRPVLAIDMPGNGESDALLESDAISPASYARCVGAALAAEGISDIEVFGRYSGGLTGLELALQDQVSVSRVIQSGAMLFTQSESQDLCENYTPDITPIWNGAHLLTAWHMMRDQALFWPWYDRRAEAMVSGPPRLDVELIQLRVNELLKCGNRYQQAYRSAFSYPLSERLRQCNSPVTFASPTWDPLHSKSRKAASLSRNAGVEELPGSMADWATSIWD